MSHKLRSSNYENSMVSVKASGTDHQTALGYQSVGATATALHVRNC